MRRCKFCGKEIEWLERQGARPVPVDPEPVFVIEGKGYDRFLTEEEGELVGRAAYPHEVRTRQQKLVTPLGFVPHRRTCKCQQR